MEAKKVKIITINLVALMILSGLSLAQAIAQTANSNSGLPIKQINKKASEKIIDLSQEHINAVNRSRRIVLQYDAFGNLGIDFNKWIMNIFESVDQPGSQIDAIWWDIGGGANMAPYPGKIGKLYYTYEDPGIKKWWDQGIDWIEELVRESRKRKLEVFWNHRISEVDIGENPFRNSHPNWLVKSWYYPGLWNLATPEVRQVKVEFLKELIEKYEFDGVQLDFARHIPCLPVGHQWELRDNVTEFVRMVRLMMLEEEKKLGRPLLLAAKVPEKPEGCRIDGFDVETWAQQNLIDIFTLGTRSMDVDVSAYRRITASHNIKLQPCWDDYHSTDAYKSPPHEILRAVLVNWWEQGADGIMIFNWSASGKYDRERLVSIGSEGGSPETLALKDKTFVVERRGGYPWGEGYFGQNNTSPLPAILANDSRPAIIKLRIGDNLQAYSDKINKLTLRAIIFGAREGDEIGIRFNGIYLLSALQDFNWKDPQLFSPEPSTGGIYGYSYIKTYASLGQFRNKGLSSVDLPVDPQQKLLRIEFNIKPEQCYPGMNEVEISIIKRKPYSHGYGKLNIELEKLELHVDYF